eukprot:scaffold294697_cov20-Prasinocladus_malaysianus.AAC.1
MQPGVDGKPEAHNCSLDPGIGLGCIHDGAQTLADKLKCLPHFGVVFATERRETFSSATMQEA